MLLSGQLKSLRTSRSGSISDVSYNSVSSSAAAKKAFAGPTPSSPLLYGIFFWGIFLHKKNLATNQNMYTEAFEQHISRRCLNLHNPVLHTYLRRTLDTRTRTPPTRTTSARFRIVKGVFLFATTGHHRAKK